MIVNVKLYKAYMKKQRKTYFKTCIRCNNFFNATGKGCKICEPCKIDRWEFRKTKWKLKKNDKK